MTDGRYAEDDSTNEALGVVLRGLLSGLMRDAREMARTVERMLARWGVSAHSATHTHHSLHGNVAYGLDRARDDNIYRNIVILPVRRMDGAPSAQADTCPLTSVWVCVCCVCGCCANMRSDVCASGAP
eukprot:4848456-Prymnesium_polylepis.1